MNLFTFQKGINEIEEIVYEDKRIRIVKIHSSNHVTPIDLPYDQVELEWVSILEGEAILKVEEKEIHLYKGDEYVIKPHQKHWVTYTSEKCIWLCVYEKC